MSSPAASLALLLAGTVGAGSVAASDWPNWRGPRHDGISDETGFATERTTPLTLLWEREIGDAFSSFACVDGSVYTCGTQAKRQVLFRLDADTGEVIWQRDFAAKYRDAMGGDGVRATPTVSGGRVYIFGAHGRLVCFNAADGTEVWSRQFNHKPQWGYSGSVLIEGELAMVSAGDNDGALVALNKNTGAPMWKCGDDPVGYATPYPFTFNDRRYLVGFMGNAAVVADVATGRQVWRTPWKTNWNVNASSPIFHDGHLFLSSGYGHGCTLLKLSPSGDGLTARTVWESKVLRNKFQSCVLHEGHLYTSDEKALKCVEFLTGEEKWVEARMKHGTVVLADGHLLVLTPKGELLIAPATPTTFQPTTRAQILSGRCWTVPTLYRGRIYARNLSRVVCFDLMK